MICSQAPNRPQNHREPGWKGVALLEVFLTKFCPSRWLMVIYLELGSVDHIFVLKKDKCWVHAQKQVQLLQSAEKKNRTIFFFNRNTSVQDPYWNIHIHIYIYIYTYIHIYIYSFPIEVSPPPKMPQATCGVFFFEAWQLQTESLSQAVGWLKAQLPRVKPPKSNLVHCKNAVCLVKKKSPSKRWIPWFDLDLTCGCFK